VVRAARTAVPCVCTPECVCAQYVRFRGVSYYATSEEIRNFFAPLQVRAIARVQRDATQIDPSPAGVVFTLLPTGLRSGEGYARFVNALEAQRALVSVVRMPMCVTSAVCRAITRSTWAHDISKYIDRLVRWMAACVASVDVGATVAEYMSVASGVVPQAPPVHAGIRT
jgi:hypothetical protein